MTKQELLTAIEALPDDVILNLLKKKQEKISSLEKKVKLEELHDQFAMAALQGIFAQNAHPKSCGITASDYLDLAWESYKIADAMLEAREKTNG